MEQKIINLLDSSMASLGCKIKDNQIIFQVQSKQKQVACPYCGHVSSKIHSFYQREIQDIPMQDKQTILLVNMQIPHI